MFGIFSKKKKSELEVLIEKDGVEYAAKRLSEIVLEKISTTDIAYQFVLEEIEAASQGSDIARSFARSSGISPHEYRGAMRNSRPEVEFPQQFLLALCMQLQPNADLVVELRTKIVDNIMKTLSFGKYDDKASEPKNISFGKRIRLHSHNVEIMFIAKNDKAIYTNNYVDSLFKTDKDGDEKLDGRVVRFIFSGKNKVEFFVAFDDADSYVLFTPGLEVGLQQRFDSIATRILEFVEQNGIAGIWEINEQFRVQYDHAYRLYRIGNKSFMVNAGQSKALLINGEKIKSDDVDALKKEFFG